jgi:hypothetical protein
MARGTTLIVAAVLGLAGLVFVLQGLGAPLGRSFMIGDLRWTAIGAVLLIIAAGLAWRNRPGR